MPVRVELVDEAVADSTRYAATGHLPLFFQKLLRLEDVGQEAGPPLGRDPAGWRTIVVGDRDWRIVFTTDPEETVATVWVIGDRADAACDETARRRVVAVGQSDPHAATLAAVIFELAEARRATTKKR